MGYGVRDLKKGQELVMEREFKNKHDSHATVVKTLEGDIVGRVKKQLSRSAKKIMRQVKKLGIHSCASFVKMNETLVWENNGKKYLEDQPEIEVEFLLNNSSTDLSKKLLTFSRQ